MEKKVLLILEFAALLICVISGGFWLYNPEGTYEPTFAVAGLVLIITEFYRRFMVSKIKTGHSILHFDVKNTFFCKYLCEGNRRNGNISLLFYSIKIANNSGNSFTIKDINLEYENNGKIYTEFSNQLLTGSIYSPRAKKNVDAVLVDFIKNATKNRMILMGWNNIGKVIGENRVLQHGEIIEGSALFLLNFESISEVSKISEVRILISDYSNNKSIHPIKIEKKWVEMGRTCTITPRLFTSNENGNIK